MSNKKKRVSFIEPIPDNNDEPEPEAVVEETCEADAEEEVQEQVISGT